MGNDVKRRIDWLDVLKCIGIFEIFLGHFYSSAGRAYPFVFTHHVQLFFLCGGFAENFRKESDWKHTFLEKSLSLLLPFFFFSILSMGVTVLLVQCDLMDALKLCKGIVGGGVRNRYFASPLWFLTCLYVMECMFFWIQKARNRWLMVGVSLLLSVAATKLIPEIPSWPYNVDSAFYYLPFYGIGYAAFPLIYHALQDFKKHWKGIAVSGLLSAGYALCVFYGIEPFAFLNRFSLFSILFVYLKPLMIIWSLILLAYALRRIRLLQRLGRNTLYLCGNEYNVRALLPALLSPFGIELQWSTPLRTALFCGLYVLLCYAAFCPWQKKAVLWIRRRIEKRLKSL